MHKLHLSFYHLQVTKQFAHDTHTADYTVPVLKAMDADKNKTAADASIWHNLLAMFKSGNRKKNYAVPGR